MIAQILVGAFLAWSLWVAGRHALAATGQHFLRKQGDGAGVGQCDNVASLPQNTRLDDYVRSGLQSLDVHLRQAARNRHTDPPQDDQQAH
jgi:hypothetical protein